MSLFDRLFNRAVLAPEGSPASGADGGAAASVAAPDGAAASATPDLAEVLYGEQKPAEKPAEPKVDAKDPLADEGKTEQPAGKKDVTAKSPLDESDDEKPGTDEEKKDEQKTEDKAAEVTFKAEEIKMPEGIPVDKAALDAFAPVMNELKLSTEQGQKLVDKYIEIKKAEQESYENIQIGWKKAAMADPEIGKGNWDSTKAAALRGIKAFGTPEFRELLVASGLSTHPETLRFLRRAGLAVSEDKPVNNEVAGGKAFDPVAILYPKG